MVQREGVELLDVLLVLGGVANPVEHARQTQVDLGNEHLVRIWNEEEEEDMDDIQMLTGHFFTALERR